jgi:hypothetical protein
MAQPSFHQRAPLALNDVVTIKINSSGILSQFLTLWTCDDGTALILALLHDAVLADWLREGTHTEVAHEHAIMASTI